MRSMRKTSLISFIFLTAALIFMNAHPARVQAQSNPEIIEISAEDAAKFIRQDKGRVVVVLLYASWCPSCRDFFPDFLGLAGRCLERDVDVLAFSVDDTREDVEEYLRNYQLTIVPLWLPPGPQGGVAKAMATVGITYDNYIPFVAALDKKGRVVYQGRASIQALTAAIEVALKT